mmetsp:Transcript_3126/g.4505  ORF Transcript_3126/g.4505 Transcript_3126/m.4505 type:complete len:1057 (-) Transcript_3126:831-4001(-)
MATPLHGRIDSAIRTAKQWESDKYLLTEIRESIPMELLVPELVCEREAEWRSFLNDTTAAAGAAIKATKSPYFRDDDVNYEGDDILLKRLTLYFKTEVMKWCNQPPCCNSTCTGNDDGKKMETKGIRGPTTQEEKTGGASRVEVYNCTLCNTETTFPRYNSPRALLKSKRGRCGEFANLFGTYCRALGFDTRYILDFTDHVWVEVWSVRQQRWLMADSCEGLIDRPNMYEQGWGKKLSYAVGATHDSVADVSKRYTRKFLSDDFQTRRREFSPNEVMSDQVFMQMNGTVRQTSNMAKGRAEELDKRAKMEEKFFNTVQSSGVWDSEYREGRISGSLAWKAARRELGEGNVTSKTEEKKDGDDEASSEETSFWVESFLPSPRYQNDLIIAVRPKAAEGKRWSIQVNGIPCASSLANGVAVVIVDELSGCILQSKAFSDWSSVASFLNTVPDGRIVALCSFVDEKVEGEEQKESTNKTNCSESSKFGRLGGFDYDKVTSSPENFVSFIGRLAFHPTWSSFHISSESSAMEVSIQLDKSAASATYKLRSEKNTVPAAVFTRLPDYIMPLNTQLLASNYQKRVAFEAYMEKDSNSSSIVGYTTRSETPVYLIQNSAFPFRAANGPTQKTAESEDSSWTTYHYLPDAIVPDDDVVEEKHDSKNSGTPNFDIPIADDYFMGLLGSQLLVKNGTSSDPTLLDTSSALANSRLIALYFSASFCGPCRGFTPMLIEFHNVLKEEVASSHGLEIVFVSSDRSDAEFQQYYKKMPFKAMPFSQRELAQRAKSLFGVRGIPSLVIIDSLSGRIVVSPDESRREVHQACQYGEKAIERLFHSWLDKIPQESKSMIDILALSCAEADETVQTGASNTKAEAYLKRWIEKVTAPSPLSKEDIAVRVKELFPRLVAQGLAPNEAAAEAIKQATLQQSDPALESGRIGGESKVATQYKSDVKTDISVARAVDTFYKTNSDDKDKVVAVLSTAQKYVANVQKDPTNPRFRNFRLANKVFDRITSNSGSMELLQSFNFSAFHSDIDFLASIPLSVDLELLSRVLEKVLETYQSTR